jgi:MFS transporter, SP family, solute carrier family 2 (facilitated glucose transporter), member 3
VVVPVYLGEIAPPTLRGTLGTLTQFAMVIGILATDLLAFPLATPAGWRWLFAVTPGLCALQLLVSPLLLESPRWLLGRDPHSPEARAAIKRIRGFRFDDEVEEEAQHYLYAAQKHKTSRDSAHAAGAMYDLLFRQVDLRPLVVSSIVLQMAQQLSGINAVFYYSTDFFEGVMEKPLLGTTLCASVNVVATYVALKLMDGTPRRTLILWSTGGMVVSTVVITLALTGVVVRSLALAGVLAFVSCFEIGLGPIPWLIVAEMFDAKYVATAMSIACVVNWASNFVVGLSFPFVAHALGAWTWAPFGAIVAATFCFTLWYLPETHGRSVEEINRLVSRYGPDEEELQRQAIHIIQAVEPLDLPPPVGKD